MLVVNIHQAGSADADLQQRVARYTGHTVSKSTSARHCRKGFFDANAHGQQVGYSPSNAHHMEKIDDQFQVCVSLLKGTPVSPRMPSRIDERMCKEARVDHLLGLGVELEFTSHILGGFPVPGPCQSLICSQGWKVTTDAS
jgi:hypothetical protein